MQERSHLGGQEGLDQGRGGEEEEQEPLTGGFTGIKSFERDNYCHFEHPAFDVKGK